MDEETEAEIRRIVQEELHNFFGDNLNRIVEMEVQRQLELAKDRELEEDILEEQTDFQAARDAKFKQLVTELKETQDLLYRYVDSTLDEEDRPTIIFRNGDQVGVGTASQESGDVGGFKKLGFNGYTEFFALPLEKRNEFLQEALSTFRDLFGEEAGENMPLEELLKKYELLQTSFQNIRASL
jgi:hypothetical protein